MNWSWFVVPDGHEKPMWGTPTLFVEMSEINVHCSNLVKSLEVGHVLPTQMPLWSGTKSQLRTDCNVYLTSNEMTLF